MPAIYSVEFAGRSQVSGCRLQYEQNLIYVCLSLFPSPSSPVRFLGGTPFRYMYCIIMSCWGADVTQNIFNRSLYYHSDNGLLDAFKVFGMLLHVVLQATANTSHILSL